MTWEAKALSEVVELRRGFDLPHAERQPGDVPILSAGQSVGSHNVSMVEGPGFAVGRATNLGVPTWSDRDYWPLNTTLYAADFKGNDPAFLFRLFQALDLRGFDSGSVQPMLNRNYIAQVPVRIPALAEQRAIAEVLGALDDKIAANERLVDTLQLLTDALGRELILRAEPGAGDTVGDLADIVNGLSYRSAELEEGAADNLVTLKSVTREGRYAERGLKGFRGVSKSEQRVTAGDIVVAQTDLTQAADVVGRAVRLPKGGLGTGDAVASLDLAVVRPMDALPSELLLAVLRDEQFRQHCLAHTSGTTVLHLRRGAIASYPMPRIDVATNGDFVKRTRSFNARQDAAAVESRALAGLRDALLPELMSGRLRVKDAEKTVEGVV